MTDVFSPKQKAFWDTSCAYVCSLKKYMSLSFDASSPSLVLLHVEMRAWNANSRNSDDGKEACWASYYLSIELHGIPALIKKEKKVFDKRIV